jgi:putative endonuclease
MNQPEPSEARRSGESEHYVYIGLLQDGRFYVGVSHQHPRDLLAEHQSGHHSRFTRAERLLRIPWTEPHPSLKSARTRERPLKRWTHAKKQALIDGDLAGLKKLARRKTR